MAPNRRSRLLLQRFLRKVTLFAAFAVAPIMLEDYLTVFVTRVFVVVDPLRLPGPGVSGNHDAAALIMRQGRSLR